MDKRTTNLMLSLKVPNLDQKEMAKLASSLTVACELVMAGGVVVPRDDWRELLSAAGLDKGTVRDLIEAVRRGILRTKERITIPVTFDRSYEKAIEMVAEANGMTVEELVEYITMRVVSELTDPNINPEVTVLVLSRDLATRLAERLGLRTLTLQGLQKVLEVSGAVV